MAIEVRGTGLAVRMAEMNSKYMDLRSTTPQDAFFRYVVDRLALPSHGVAEAQKIRQHEIRRSHGAIATENGNISVTYVFHGDPEHGKGAGHTRLVRSARYVLVSATVITAQNLGEHLYTLGTNLQEYNLTDGNLSENVTIERRKAAHLLTLKFGENNDEVLLWLDVVLSNAVVKPSNNGGKQRNLSISISTNQAYGKDFVPPEEYHQASESDEARETQNILNGNSTIGSELREWVNNQVSDLQFISNLLIGKLTNTYQEFFIVVDSV